MKNNKDLDSIIRRLEAMTRGAGDEFSEDEIEQIRQLLVMKDEIVEFMNYRTSLRIVYRKWRGLIIGIASVIVAIAAVNEKVMHFLKGLL